MVAGCGEAADVLVFTDDIFMSPGRRVDAGPYRSTVTPLPADEEMRARILNTRSAAHTACRFALAHDTAASQLYISTMYCRTKLYADTSAPGDNTYSTVH